MSFSEEEIVEFRTEAFELLTSAEEALLAIEAGADYRSKYDFVFRAFHSVKGAAGMMEMFPLQAHVHQLETFLVSVKDETSLAKDQVTYFLTGCDSTRTLLEGRPAPALPDFPGRALAPIAAPAEAPGAPTPAISPVPDVTVSPKVESAPKAVGRFIVLDDQPDFSEVLGALLRNAGHQVHGFTDPREAVKFLIHNPIDVVFTDVNMPGMTGVDVLTAVRKIDSELPVIFVTGGCSREDLIRAIDLGVFAVIEKPWRIEQVQNLADKAIRLRRLNELVNSSMSLLMSQFTAFDSHLKATANFAQRAKLKSDVLRLLDQRKALRRAG